MTHAVAQARAATESQARTLKHDQLGVLQVQCAINRATKEKRVAELTDLLERSDVAFAVRYNKIPVKKFESFRRSLPADAKLCVAKNTLMKQAVSRVSISSLWHLHAHQSKSFCAARHPALRQRPLYATAQRSDTDTGSVPCMHGQSDERLSGSCRSVAGSLWWTG